jgi:hypothetical protein
MRGMVGGARLIKVLLDTETDVHSGNKTMPRST